MHTLFVSWWRHVQIGVHNTIGLVTLHRQYGLGILQLNATLHSLLKVKVVPETARFQQNKWSLAFVLPTLVWSYMSAVRIVWTYVRNITVPHQVLFVHILDGLKVALCCLEAETMALLQGYLDVLLLLRFGCEGLALGELLLLE